MPGQLLQDDINLVTAPVTFTVLDANWNVATVSLPDNAFEYASVEHKTIDGDPTFYQSPISRSLAPVRMATAAYVNALYGAMFKQEVSTSEHTHVVTFGSAVVRL